MGLTIGLLIMIALLLAFNYWILSNVKELKEKKQRAVILTPDRTGLVN